MAEVTRIGVKDAYQHVSAGQAFLVCAYDDEAKCRQIALKGSIPLTQFVSRAPSLPKDQEIIFYCAWPAEATSAGQAAKYQAQGLTNVKALKGGVTAWEQAGYPTEWWLHRTMAPPDSGCQARWRIGLASSPCLRSIAVSDWEEGLHYLSTWERGAHLTLRPGQLLSLQAGIPQAVEAAFSLTMAVATLHSGES